LRKEGGRRQRKGKGVVSEELFADGRRKGSDEDFDMNKGWMEMDNQGREREGKNRYLILQPRFTPLRFTILLLNYQIRYKRYVMHT